MHFVSIIVTMLKFLICVFNHKTATNFFSVWVHHRRDSRISFEIYLQISRSHYNLNRPIGLRHGLARYTGRAVSPPLQARRHN